MQLRQNRETEKRHFKIVIIHIYEKSKENNHEKLQY